MLLPTHCPNCKSMKTFRSADALEKHQKEYCKWICRECEFVFWIKKGIRTPEYLPEGEGYGIEDSEQPD